jgi:hypothetical protein
LVKNQDCAGKYPPKTVKTGTPEGVPFHLSLMLRKELSFLLSVGWKIHFIND